jgi:hypothetical protein
VQAVHLSLAVDAIDSPRNSLESLFRNFTFAAETRTVLASLEPCQRDFDLAEEAVCPLQVVCSRFPLRCEKFLIQVIRGSFNFNLGPPPNALPQVLRFELEFDPIFFMPHSVHRPSVKAPCPIRRVPCAFGISILWTLRIDYLDVLRLK